MASSGTLRRVALVRTDVSEELSVSIIRVTGIGELGTLAVTSNRRTASVPSSPILVNLMMEALSSSETLVLTKDIWHNNPEDAVLHSDRRENLKSCLVELILDSRFHQRFQPGNPLNVSQTHYAKAESSEGIISLIIIIIIRV
jgi:hypothetical protein